MYDRLTELRTPCSIVELVRDCQATRRVSSKKRVLSHVSSFQVSIRKNNYPDNSKFNGSATPQELNVGQYVSSLISTQSSKRLDMDIGAHLGRRRESHLVSPSCPNLCRHDASQTPCNDSDNSFDRYARMLSW